MAIEKPKIKEAMKKAMENQGEILLIRVPCDKMPTWVQKDTQMVAVPISFVADAQKLPESGSAEIWETLEKQDQQHRERMKIFEKMQQQQQ